MREKTKFGNKSVANAQFDDSTEKKPFKNGFLPKNVIIEGLASSDTNEPIGSPSFMQYPDSGLFPTRKGKIFAVKLIRQSKILTIPIAITGILFNHITRRFSIHQKITYGYILSLGIAVLGTGVGLIVGEHYDDKGVEQLRIAQERYKQFDQLEKSVLEAKLNQQNIVIASEKKSLRSEEIEKLQASITQVNKHLNQLKKNLNDYHNLPQDYATELKTFLSVCDPTIKSYTELLPSLLQQVKFSNSTPQQIQRKEQIVQEIINIKQSTNVEKISERLDNLVNSTITQENQAKDIFKRAKVLRFIIIVASMAMSVAIALALALHTSRAIAHPIKAVTKVAKKATQEGNYDLQAPVLSDDEIGILAISLNQLIQKVATQIHELKQAQAQLIQGEKMSSLGQMVAGIAHEINNPVNFIYANLDYVHNYSKDLLDLIHLYQQHYPQAVPEIKDKIEELDLDFISEDLPKIISSLHTGSERIRQIILSLRAFCHLDESEMKQVDIQKGIDQTLLILNHRINQGVEVIKQYENVPLIECYPAQLNQVFWHIIGNAIDELIFHQDSCSHPQIIIQTKLVSSSQIEVRIQDNGMGINPKIKDKIFEPFFTTKPVGKGTGMGLAICYQIVEKHRGTIQVISQLSKGSEFVIRLPVQPH